ncbi:3-oxoadipate enol-lactonase [Notoacmeibacter sp. MSK16QG-6]|uniref:3-oxoadipate enol-lactonase n=1 Tax=Notoacmeibacter sp. MSK16QG-6 TaxID=2957982 RepID=UPI0020A1DDE2|nr:3-oxoadipate enol-lactonase [Notoacmeibacter sp. MSK16QG-6]MCP1199605.1 3-oxoadipate enol-lactonase [Notoacmeibacter sp. MSK16QG-6]
MQSVSPNGVALHYDVRGNASGPTIFFSNSLGTDFRIWDAVGSELADDYRLVFYDKRGHGLSGLPNGPLSMSNHVDDLIGLIEHVDCGPAIVCGLSVGGQIAQGVYGKRSDLVSALVLMDTAHKIGSDEMWNTRIEHVRSKGIAAISSDILARWFTDDFRRGDPQFPLYRAMLERTPVKGYAGTCEALRDSDFTEVAQSITVPTLLLVGEEDGSTPPQLVQSTADLIAGSLFETIGGAGHLPNIEQPGAVVRHMRSFLNGLGGTRA